MSLTQDLLDNNNKNNNEQLLDKNENINNNTTITRVTTRVTYDEEKSKDLWCEVFPFEIKYIPLAMNYQYFTLFASVFYGTGIMGFAIYAMYKVFHHTYIQKEDGILLIILLNMQGLLLLMMPYICYWFFKLMIANDDMKELIKFALQNDSNIKLKVNFFTHLNFACTLVATVLYIVFEKRDLFHVTAIIILSFFFLWPAIAAGCIAACFIELHRIKIEDFRKEVNLVRLNMDIQHWNWQTGGTIENSARLSELEMNTRHSYGIESQGFASSDSVHSPFKVLQLQESYYRLYALCYRSSQRIGIYVLYFIFFGFFYAFATIIGIYMDEYPTDGLLGFFIAGFVISFGLGAVLTACNETGEYNDFILFSANYVRLCSL